MAGTTATLSGLHNDSRNRRQPQNASDRLPIQTPYETPWLFTKEEMEQSPSRLSGVSKSVEFRVIARMCRFLSDAGNAMSLPQLTISLATTFFQRFFMLESMRRHSPPLVAAACLFLACKVQETHKRLKDVIFFTVKTRTKGSKDFPDGLDMFEDTQGYVEEKMNILDKEREVLRVLNFDLTVEHPYQHVWTLSNCFLGNGEHERSVLQASWNFLNDSFRTYVHVLYDPREIATSALYLGAKLNEFELQDGNQRHEETGKRIFAWHELFNCDLDRIEEICHMMLDMYDPRTEEANVLAKGTGIDDVKKDAVARSRKRRSPSQYESPARYEPAKRVKVEDRR